MCAHLIAWAIASAMLFATSASATVVLSGDSGGKMEEYAARFRQVSASGETVEIDSACSSACTMVLGMVPRNRVCATENAVLGFHAAWMYDTAATTLRARSLSQMQSVSAPLVRLSERARGAPVLTRDEGD